MCVVVVGGSGTTGWDLRSSRSGLRASRGFDSIGWSDCRHVRVASLGAWPIIIMAGGFDSQLLSKSVDTSGCVLASTMVSCEICMSHLSSLE